MRRERFIARHGITRFAPNPFFPVNTLVIMRGAIAAQQLGVFERYVDEMYRAHVGRAEEARRSRTCCARHWSNRRLACRRAFELVQTQEVKDELLANTQRSVERGTFGSPTFFVGEEIYFGKDRLRDVEEAIGGGPG